MTHHIFKIAPNGGVNFITSSADGDSPAEALAAFVAREARDLSVVRGYRSPLVGEGDTCMVIEGYEGGTPKNPNGARSLFRVERPVSPPLVVNPVGL